MIELKETNTKNYKLMMLDLGFLRTIKVIADWDFLSPEELIKELECCIEAYKKQIKIFLDKEDKE